MSKQKLGWESVAAFGALALSLVSLPAWAQVAAPADAQEKTPAVNANKQGQNLFDYTARGGGAPKELLDNVGVKQKLNEQVPMNLAFKDENGRDVKLGDYFRGKPVILSMLQFTCDQICSAQFQVMTNSLRDLQFTPGQEFELITVSIDPRESPMIAQNAKEERLKEYGRAGAEKGWHFLTGDEKNTKALASALGINYSWDAGSKQYIHPDGLVLVTPDGHISRYFLQLDYDPRDLRFGLIEASKDQIGTVVDRIALACFHYNPVTGKYTFQINVLLRFIAVAFVLGGLTAIALTVMAEKRRAARNDETAHDESAKPKKGRAATA